jgi:type I site-specific restriction endonuclease
MTPAQTPEDRARETIDGMLRAASWIVQSREETNLSAGRGIAIREFPMKSGFGEADYLLYADSQAIGVVEAKKEGSTLTGFEIQTAKYSEGLPDSLPAPRRPLPFCYQSTGVETRFTNLLEPDAASRNVFSFHQPETLAERKHRQECLCHKNPSTNQQMLSQHASVQNAPNRRSHRGNPLPVAQPLLAVPAR